MKKQALAGLAGATLLLSIATLPAAAAPAYRFTPIDVPFAGATETELFEITDSGLIVGSYLDEVGARQGFLLENGAYTTISAPGANATRVLGMNASGQMVGFYRTDADPGSQHAFLRQADGTFETIDHPGQSFNYAFRINDSGQVSGYYFKFPSTPSGIFITSHLREPDGSFAPRLFAADGDGTVLRGLNNDGKQAGWWLAPDGGIHGVVGANGVFAQFDVPGAAFTLPNDINDAGLIAGFAPDETFVGQSFIRLTDGTFSFVAVPGAHSTEVLGINNLGQLVGTYEDEDGNLHGFVAQIPEPGSLWLVCCALLLGTRRIVRRLVAERGPRLIAVFLGFVANAALAVPYRATQIDFPDPLATGGTLVAAIDNAEQIAGSYYNADFSTGPVFRGGVGTFASFAPPPGSISNAWSMNNAGQIVGTLFYTTADPNAVDNRGFILSGGAFQVLSFPGSSDTAFTGITDDGTRAAGWFEGDDENFHGFTYDSASGAFQQIDAPGRSNTFLWGLNNAGVMVGVVTGGIGLIIDSGAYTEYTRPGSTFTALQDVNNTGTILGDSDLGPFLLTNGVVTPIELAISGAASISVLGINDAGVLAGYYIDADDVFHGFVARAVPASGTLWLSVAAAIGFVASRARGGLRRVGVHLLLATLGLTAMVHGSADAAPALRTLDVPSADWTQARGINDSGQITGWYLDALGIHGYVRSGNNVQTLDVPGGTATFALGLNNVGKAVGAYEDASFVAHGFLWDGSNFIAHDAPGAQTTTAIGINDADAIVGFFEDAVGQYGYLLQGGSFTTLAYPLLPGASEIFTTAHDINNDGIVIGYSEAEFENQDELIFGWMFADGNFTRIDMPGAKSTIPFGINDAGDIVGEWYDAADVQRAFLLRDGVFGSFDFPDTQTTIASGINARGDIVGLYIDAGGTQHGFIGAQVPAPGTVILLGLGVLALRVHAWRWNLGDRPCLNSDKLDQPSLGDQMRSVVALSAIAFSLFTSAVSAQGMSHEELTAAHDEMERAQQMMETKEAELEREHDEMVRRHKEIAGGTDGAKHKAVERQHQRTIKAHTQLEKRHAALVQRHAQLEQLHAAGKVSKEKMMRDHAQMKREHERMLEDHEKMIVDHEVMKAEHEQMLADHGK